MTRTYELRSSCGRKVIATFRIPREKRPGFMAEYRATCARVLANWAMHGFTVVRRLPPRRISGRFSDEAWTFP